jgi:acyl carrier protein
MKTLENLQPQIRNVLRDHGRLKHDVGALRAEDDLCQYGLTSHASINVMLALEAAFDIELPDHMLKRSVFSSIASIERALTELTAA